MDIARAIANIDLPFPEPIPAIAFQLVLVLAGKKPCCFVPFYSPAIDLGPNLTTMPTTRGIVVIRRDTLVDERSRLLTEIIERPGLALGYGVPDKPASPHSFVKTLLSDKSVELISIVCDEDTEDTIDSFLERCQTHAPGSTIIKTTAILTTLRRLEWWTAYYQNLQT
jgi:hypothetical protein